MWTLYTVGYILSGPIAHQIIISQWFKRHRGKAMAATYLGVGVFGGLVVKYFAAPITQATNFQNALFWTGIAVLLVLPALGLLFTLVQRNLVEETERPAAG